MTGPSHYVPTRKAMVVWHHKMKNSADWGVGNAEVTITGLLTYEGLRQAAEDLRRQHDYASLVITNVVWLDG